MTDPTPVQAEADESIETVEIEWLGHPVRLPASTDDWDIDVSRAFARGDIVQVVEALVGRKEFREIERRHRAEHDGRMTNRDLAPLGDRIAEIYGFGSLGKS